MDIHLDAGSAVPPYEQIRLRIAHLAATGALPAGTKLPPVRELAATLNLATNTVARAYRELEHAGLLHTRGRAGTVVTARAAGTPDEALDAARRYADTTRRLGIGAAQALDLARTALQT